MKYLGSFFIICIFLFFSCGKDVDCSSTSIESEISAGNEKIEKLGLSLAAEFNEDVCNELKDELNKQLDYLESLKSCSNITQSSIDENIQIARGNLNNTICS
ncbi:MAG: hypothetical protein V3V00_03870 [Saprospiraceae bacterium]